MALERGVPVQYGIDFGTSNSAIAAAYEDGSVRLIDFPREAGLPTPEGEGGRSGTLPTVLFAPEYEREIHMGHTAIARYLFTGLEGRFVQSMKAYLPSSSFSGTTIGNRNYSIEDLVATYLRLFLRAAEISLGHPIEGPVVLGRPARFAIEPEADALAQRRLEVAAERAGLTDVRFVIEPVAAALAYEAGLEADELVFVADLGGGTSDFTVTRVGPSRKNEQRSPILASGGVPVAGDKFDGELVRSRLFEPLGYGSDYLALTDRARVPDWLYHKLLMWNHVSFLKSRKYLEFLRTVRETSNRPEAIAALLQIVEDDMGYLLYRAVERCKRELASAPHAFIEDEEYALPVREEVTQAQFLQATTGQLGAIVETAESVLAAAGVEAGQIDAVFLTGGTSLIPSVRAAFGGLFGAGKIRSRSTFTSVVDGLARSGIDMARGSAG